MVFNMTKTKLVVFTALASVILILVCVASVFWRSPKIAFFNTETALIKGDSGLFMDAVDPPALKEYVSDVLADAVGKKIRVDLGGDCEVSRTVFESALDKYFVDNMISRKNSIDFFFKRMAEEPDSKLIEIIDEAYDYKYLNLDKVLLTLITKKGKVLTFIYERRGLLDWKIVAIQGVDFGEIVDVLIAYKGDLIKDHDSFCKVAKEAKYPAFTVHGAEVGQKEMDVTPKSKSSNSRSHVKHRRTVKNRSVESPLTTACEIQRNLIKQGFKIPATSCQ